MLRRFYLIILLLVTSHAGFCCASNPTDFIVNSATTDVNKTNGHLFDAIVAKDGSGDFNTVQSAINAAVTSPSRPYLIFIKNGEYDEMVLIPEEKSNIHLIGQDAKKTIIKHTLHSGSKNDVFFEYSVNNPDADSYGRHAVVEVAAKDFYAENITFMNTYGVQHQSGPQALAIRSLTDRQSFHNCRFRSFQDTWFTSPVDGDRQYVYDCYIEGAVDYLYGGGDILLEKCTFYNVRSGSVITAPCHQLATRFGYVMRDCIVDGNEKAADGRQKLGRPWHNSPVTVYINTVMRIPIAPDGWSNMGAIPALFAEYNSTDIHGNALNTSQRKTQYQYVERQTGDTIKGSCPSAIDQQTASKYTYENIIQARDGWNPRLLMKKTAAPQDLRYRKASHTLSWKTVDEAIGYIIIDDNERVVGTTKACKIKVANPGKRLTVRPVSGSGSLGEPSSLQIDKTKDEPHL